jgi:hypothetical protein
LCLKCKFLLQYGVLKLYFPSMEHLPVYMNMLCEVRIKLFISIGFISEDWIPESCEVYSDLMHTSGFNSNL